MAVDDFYYIVRFGNIVGYIMFDDLTFIVSIQNLFLHHALAYGCHLRAVFGVHNRCHDVTAECGTDLVQQVLVGLTFFFVLVAADFERSTIGCQSAGQCGRYARTEVTTDDGCAHQADLRLFFFEQVDEDGRMGKGSVWEQARSVEYMKLVNAERQYLFFNACQIVSGGNSFQLAAQLISQFTTFGQEFETDIGNRSAFYL